MERPDSRRSVSTRLPGIPWRSMLARVAEGLRRTAAEDWTGPVARQRSAGHLEAGAADALRREDERPGFWRCLGDGMHKWINDNADGLRAVSPVLKGAAVVCSLAGAPFIGVALGGVALGIDLTTKFVADQGSWVDTSSGTCRT